MMRVIANVAACIALVSAPLAAAPSRELANSELSAQSASEFCPAVVKKVAGGSGFEVVRECQTAEGPAKVVSNGIARQPLSGPSNLGGDEDDGLLLIFGGAAAAAVGLFLILDDDDDDDGDDDGGDTGIVPASP